MNFLLEKKQKLRSAIVKLFHVSSAQESGRCIGEEILLA
jgi:hypothetical protein